MTTDHYLPDEVYDRLVDALHRAECEPFGLDRREKIIEALGDIGGIWPDMCRRDFADENNVARGPVKGASL